MEQTLGSMLSDAARLWPERPAVLHDGAVVTYADLHAQVHRLAARLAGLGVEGKRIGVLLPNLPTFPQVYYALLAAGARPVMLNPVNSPREVAEYLTDAASDTVATVSSLADLAPAGSTLLLADDLPLLLRVRSSENEHVLPLSNQGDVPLPPRPAPTAEAAVLFTAASGGRARGAPLSHRNLIANLRSTVEAVRLTHDDRVVAPLPLIHAFGLTVCLNAPLAVGAAVIPVERFHPARLLALLQSERATVLCGVPGIYLGLIAAAERQGVPNHTLRVALCGGAPLDPAVARRWEELFGIPLRQGYGLTEAGPVCLFNHVDRPNQPGTLGQPLPDVAVSIRGPDGEPLPDGEVGEICVRGPNVFRGYLGERRRRPADFHGDWLRTGDLGSEEPGGTVRFRGVTKPMFTHNGFNVYPRELERVLTADPRIASVVVSARPDPLKENEIVLSVRPKRGVSLSEQEVRELCRARLAAYKQPSRVLIEET